MIHTELAPSSNPLIVQRMSGIIDLTEVERGIAAALRLVDEVLAQHPAFDLLLDLRDLHFTDLRAHKAWRLGFLAHPAITLHARRAAIIGSDTPSFRAEQDLLETANCRFFVDVAAGHAWLGTTDRSTEAI